MERKYFFVDAKGKILGRMATRIACILRGKHKHDFDPAKDMGDIVVVVNASAVKVTGRKSEQKTYFRHSNYPSGHKLIPFERMLREKPCEIIRHAVNGMLPHNRLQSKAMRRLKIYAGAEHGLNQKYETLEIQ